MVGRTVSLGCGPQGAEATVLRVGVGASVLCGGTALSRLDGMNVGANLMFDVGQAVATLNAAVLTPADKRTRITPPSSEVELSVLLHVGDPAWQSARRTLRWAKGKG